MVLYTHIYILQSAITYVASTELAMKLSIQIVNLNEQKLLHGYENLHWREAFAIIQTNTDCDQGVESSNERLYHGPPLALREISSSN